MKCKDCTSTLCSYRTTDGEKECFFDKHEGYPLPRDLWPSEDGSSVDWSAFRREAAKEILAASYTSDLFTDTKTLVSGCIQAADELIKQLKEDQQ